RARWTRRGKAVVDDQDGWRLGIELGQRLLDASRVVEEIPHSPALARARVRRSPVQDVIARARVRAGNDTPTRAIPMFDQRLKDAEVDELVPHGPDVAGRDNGDA